jgi:predicted nucleic acid-binding protein
MDRWQKSTENRRQHPGEPAVNKAASHSGSTTAIMGGTWIASREAIAEKKWYQIRENRRAAAVELCKPYKVSRATIKNDLHDLEAARHIELELTGYDAFHVALAEELGALWLTFDATAHSRLQQKRISVDLGTGMPVDW